MRRLRLVLLLAAVAGAAALVSLRDRPRRLDVVADAGTSSRRASNVDSLTVAGSRPVVATRPIIPGRSLARGPVVRGRVVDRAASRPVAHATVRLELTWGGDDSDPPTAESFDVRTPVTEDGDFCVVVPHRASFIVTAQAGGFAVAGKDRVASGEEVELVLDRPVRLTGRVLHKETRQPLAGAEIRAWIPSCPGAVRTVRTDFAGAWAFDDLPPVKVTFETHLAGFVWRQLETDLAKGAAERDVLLDPGLSISGRVIAADTGAPIPGARVNLWGWAPAYSDERGVFTLSGLWAGTWSLHAQARGMAAGWAQVTIDERSVEGVVITLARWREIAGIVVDELNRPLAGVSVDAGADAFETGADGRFAVGHEFRVEPEAMSLESTISASREGFTPLSVEIERGQRDVTLRLLPADVTVRGRVEDHEGRPIEGARVSCRPGPPRNGVTGTDAEGAFVFERCPRAAEYDVAVSAPGHAETKLELQRPDGAGSVEASIVLRQLRRIRVLGTVKDETGAAVSGARVEVLVRGNDGDGHRDRRAAGKTESGPDGGFEVEAPLARPGPVGLMASAAGHRNAEVGVDPRDDVSRFTLTLCRLGRLRGRVVDAATGEPVRKATIELQYEGGCFSGFFGRTSDTADFSFEAPSAKFHMDVKAEGYLFHRQPVEVAACATTDAGSIELKHGGAIEGTIRPAPGCPQRQLGIVLATAGRASFRWAGETDSVGRFHLDEIAPGSWEVFGAEEAGAYGDSRTRVVRLCSFGSLEVGQRTVGRVDGVMPLPATIVVAARLGGRPPSEAPATFSAYGPDSHVGRLESTGAPWFRLSIRSLDGIPLALARDGSTPEFAGWWQGDALNASIATLPAGRYRVSVTSGARRPAEAEVRVEEGGSRKVSLELSQ